MLDIIDGLRPAQGWNITEAVTLGLGRLVYFGKETLPKSFAEWPEERRRSYTRAPLLQLAAFIDVVQKIEHSAAQTVVLLAQDPAFSSADVGFLAKFGIEVVQNPEAQRRIHSSTFTFCPFLRIEVERNILARCPPTQPQLHIAAAMSRHWYHGNEYLRGLPVHKLEECSEDVKEEVKVIQQFTSVRLQREWPEAVTWQDHMGGPLAIYGIDTQSSNDDQSEECKCTYCVQNKTSPFKPV